jgi:hypothetical protein
VSGFDVSAADRKKQPAGIEMFRTDHGAQTAEAAGIGNPLLQRVVEIASGCERPRQTVL